MDVSDIPENILQVYGGEIHNSGSESQVGRAESDCHRCHRCHRTVTGWAHTAVTAPIGQKEWRKVKEKIEEKIESLLRIQYISTE